MRSDWTTGGKTYPAGALIATHLEAFLKGERAFDVLFEPGERKSLAGFSPTLHHVLLTELDNVRSRVYVVTHRDGRWQREPLPGVPEFGEVSVHDVDSVESDDYFLDATDFLTPSTLALGTAGGGPATTLKQLPAFFDAGGLAVSQHEAVSKDGTRVPYFEVARKDLALDGKNPTLLYGYGGFEVSMLPSYRPAVGAAWLEKGGVYVVANIRGGGEFGPKWHQSALKANRHKAYDDFIAVALDLIRRKVTSPPHLGTQGESNEARKELEEALTGRFRDIHATEIAVHLRLIDAINAEIALLDEQIGQHLPSVPGTAPACSACGLIGGGHAPDCDDLGILLLGLADRLDEITGVGAVNGRALIAELGTDPSQFPTPGHAAGWARLTPRSRQSGETAKPGRTGKGNRYLRGALGQAAMTAAKTDTRLGAMYRRIARKRGKQKAIVAVSRVICEIAWILICDPSARYTELGPDYYHPRSPARQTRDKIREIERLNPGKKVILADAEAA